MRVVYKKSVDQLFREMLADMDAKDTRKNLDHVFLSNEEARELLYVLSWTSLSGYGRVDCKQLARSGTGTLYGVTVRWEPFDL